MVIFVLIILGWFIGGMIGFSIGFVGLLCIIISFGIGLFNMVDFWSIFWDILFMFGGGFCLGVVFDESGLIDMIVYVIFMD